MTATAPLNVIFGPSGAGKTTYANAFARREGAVALILDDWMARLFGPDIPQPVEFDWVMERVGRCEALMWSVAAGVIASGRPVIMDLGLLRVSDRDRVRMIAEATELALQFHYVTAAPQVRRARVDARNKIQGESFALEITPAMFDFVEGIFEPATEAELAGAIITESA